MTISQTKVWSLPELNQKIRKAQGSGLALGASDLLGALISSKSGLTSLIT